VTTAKSCGKQQINQSTFIEMTYSCFFHGVSRSFP